MVNSNSIYSLFYFFYKFESFLFFYPPETNLVNICRDPDQAAAKQPKPKPVLHIYPPPPASLRAHHLRISIFPASFVTVLQIYLVHLWSISSSLHPQQFSVDVTDMNHNLISHFLLSVKCRFVVVRFHRFFF